MLKDSPVSPSCPGVRAQQLLLGTVAWGEKLLFMAQLPLHPPYPGVIILQLIAPSSSPSSVFVQPASALPWPPGCLLSHICSPSTFAVLFSQLLLLWVLAFASLADPHLFREPPLSTHASPALQPTWICIFWPLAEALASQWMGWGV